MDRKGRFPQGRRTQLFRRPPYARASGPVFPTLTKSPFGPAYRHVGQPCGQFGGSNDRDDVMEQSLRKERAISRRRLNGWRKDLRLRKMACRRNSGISSRRPPRPKCDEGDQIAVRVCLNSVHHRSRARLYAATAMADNSYCEDATDPKMPPCALIIANPISWN